MNAAIDCYVLDTSAVLALIEQEPGAEVVERLLTQAHEGEVHVLLSFMTFMEVFYITLQERDESEAKLRLELMKALPVLRVESSQTTGITASEYKARHHLSVADAWIAALAREQRAILVHKDPEFDQVEADILVLKLPYKRVTP